ncbi:MAG TPA: hypothetical protein VK794_04770 [Steroidobacteraceae bacterium]|jgi:hypothetical protein|nr:hypothetical protein [Steroidobacteraceae bacterium]
MDEKYQARQAERKRQEQERAPKPRWWLGQTDPIAKFTAWLVVFTGGLVIVTAGLVLVGILQRCSIEGQLAEMQLDQRAWLGGSNYKFEITESKLEISVMVSNTGKTPAMVVIAQIQAIPKSKGSPISKADIVYPKDSEHNQGTIFPNQSFPVYVRNTEPIDLAKQKALFEQIKTGDSVEYFFGYVEYWDISGKDHHWTHFCGQYVPSTNSGTPCPIYNDTDDDKRDPRSKAP